MAKRKRSRGRNWMQGVARGVKKRGTRGSFKKW
jgi:hypothetical protein